eukprot:evm.model.scf_1234.3 EVM.evm.TU.scf_1234.3   scf_1234:21267-28694(+)
MIRRAIWGVARRASAVELDSQIARYQSATDAAAQNADIVAASQGKTQATEVFDRSLKHLHRNRAAMSLPQSDPLMNTTATHLLDRLLDIKREFPVVAVLGGTGQAIVEQLLQNAAGIDRLIYIDASQAMLDAVKVLEQKTMGAGKPWPKIEYIQGDEERLPLERDSVNLIISNLGMHWINDLPSALFQCQLALKPDGLFLGSMLGGNTLQELRISFALAEQEREGGVSPRVSPMVQVSEVGGLLSGAGFNVCAVDVDDIVINYENAFECMEHLRSMGESNGAIHRRTQLPRDTLLAAAAVHQSLFASEGMAQASYQVIYMSGWSPHESQQKPLRRGSAKMSLKDLGSAVDTSDKPEWHRVRPS